MNPSKIQAIRYVSSEDLVGRFSVILWDNCPFSLSKSDYFGGQDSEILSLVDLNTFKCWVNEVVQDWEGDEALIEEFNKFCNGFENERVYVSLDSEVLIERSMDGH